jgi:hypothetical protein
MRSVLLDAVILSCITDLPNLRHIIIRKGNYNNVLGDTKDRSDLHCIKNTHDKCALLQVLQFFIPACRNVKTFDNFGNVTFNLLPFCMQIKQTL